MNGLVLDTPLSGPCTRTAAFNELLIPEETRTYQPLSNKKMIHMIHRIAEESDIELSNEQLGLDLKGQRMFGTCDIEGKDFFGGSIKLMIGFCNSYNGTMSARFCIGGKVFVCSNMAFHAYTDEATGVSGVKVQPHKNFNSYGVNEGLIIQVREAFGQIGEFVKKQEGFYDGLINRRLNDDKAYAAIVRAAQYGVINKTSVLSVAQEWDRQAIHPDDVKEGDDYYGTDYEWHQDFQKRNGYSLFNAFTQQEKGRLEKNPVRSNISTMELTKFFSEEFSLN